jgi:hypothetical protein
MNAAPSIARAVPSTHFGRVLLVITRAVPSTHIGRVLLVITRAVPSTNIGRVLLAIDIVDAATLTRQYVIDTTTARERRRAR